jgi:hypothetical protein
MIREMEHGRKLLEPEGKQACTQHDQVFIANFIQLVKKVHTTLTSEVLAKEAKNV